MDPKACLAALMHAVQMHDYSGARDHALNLERWLIRGGFVPEADSREVMQALINATCALGIYVDQSRGDQ